MDIEFGPLPVPEQQHPFISESSDFVHNAGIKKVGQAHFDTRDYNSRRKFFKGQIIHSEELEVLSPRPSFDGVVQLQTPTLDIPDHKYHQRRQWYHHNLHIVGLGSTPPTSTHTHTNHRSPVTTLLLLVFCTVFGMCTWFSAGAVLPQLEKVYGINETQGSLLTLGVNFGFLIGALSSVVFALADKYSPSKLMSVGSGVAGVFNVGMLIPGCGFGGALLLRVGTGCAMALVYPMACKVGASWFVENRGLAIGFVVGSVGM